MDYRQLTETEQRGLLAALQSNGQGRVTILTDRRTTRFAGVTDDVTDDEVITAIKSVPCHY